MNRSGDARPAPIVASEEMVYRSGVGLRTIDAVGRTLELSYSSEAEVERWPGVVEVLDHSPGACDLSRLQNRAPLLFNHDLDEVLGVLESADIGADRKGRAVVRFSRNPDPEKVWTDVQDGILTKTSVGYRIQEVKLSETREDGTDVYLVTKWQPYEVSIVSVEADVTVGIGRGINTNPKPTFPKIMNRAQIIALLRANGISFTETATDEELSALVTRSLTPATPPVQTPATATPITTGAEHVAGANAERERTRQIFEAGRQYEQVDLAQRCVVEGKTLEEFRSLLIGELDKKNKAVVDSSRPIGMSDKEARSFSMVKLLRSLCATPEERPKLAEAAAFELEACGAAAEQMVHRSAKGTVIPIDVLLVGNGTRADAIIGAQTATGYTNAGTNTIQTVLQVGSFIEMLRKRSILMGRGTELGGLVGNIDIPKQLTGSSAAWVGEDTAAAKSDITFGLVSLRPRTVSNRAEITRKLLMQNSVGVENLVRMDLIKSLALEIDRAGLYGTGTSNQPKGVKNQSGITSTTWAASGAPTYAELVAMETALALSDADAGTMSYIATPGFRGYAKTAVKISGQQMGVIWEDGKTINGYNCDVSNQVTAGDIFFGNWADLLIGMWGGLDITVDPYTYSDTGRIRITQFQDLDYTIRRVESFAYGHN